MKNIITLSCLLFSLVSIHAQDMTAEKYFNRAMARDGLGMYDDALNDLNEAVKLAPNDAEIWNYRGLVYYHKNEFDKALADYNKALKLQPVFEKPWFNKGVLYLAGKKFTESVNAFNEAIRIQPTEDSFSMRGQAYLELKQYDEAMKDFDEAIRLNPSYGYYYSERGITKYYKADQQGACDDFKKAVDLGDDFSQQYVDQFCK